MFEVQIGMNLLLQYFDRVQLKKYIFSDAFASFMLCDRIIFQSGIFDGCVGDAQSAYSCYSQIAGWVGSCKIIHISRLFIRYISSLMLCTFLN
jgi:hypothetical protein